MRERPDTEADLGTLQLAGGRAFSGVSSWSCRSPSSSAEIEKRLMVSRLWALFITRGLPLRSDWEELDEVRGRKLLGPRHDDNIQAGDTHLPLGPSALRSAPGARQRAPSPGDRTPRPSQRSSFSSLWLRSDDDRL
ncbi:hypothetical protein CRUP_011266 [Coryphaenoides rupestris]|nr:hypothetical protein CRUP_011266 [Coryphaenoides rupestris]